MQSAPLLNHKVQLLRNYFNIFEQCTSFGLILLYPETSPPIAFFKHVALLISGNPLKSQLCCSKQLEIRKGQLLKFPGKHPERVLYSFYFYSNLYRRHLRPMWLFQITEFDFFSEMEQLQRDRLSKILGYFI